MSRSEDLMLLLTCGLALGACKPTVDPGDDDGPSDGGGDDREAVQDAIEICAPWANKSVECYEAEAPDEGDVEYGYSISYVSMMGYCIAQVGYAQNMGDDCVEAYDDYFVCLANTDCDEVFGDVDVDVSDDDAGGVDEPDEDTYPCAEHEVALEQACDYDSVDANESD
jgi:hypothetical protein